MIRICIVRKDPEILPCMEHLGSMGVIVNVVHSAIHRLLGKSEGLPDPAPGRTHPPLESCKVSICTDPVRM